MRCGVQRCRLPRILTLAVAEIDAYWERLAQLGLCHEYGQHPGRGPMPTQYGTALDIPGELADHLIGAVRALDAIVKEEVRAAGGVGAWLVGRAPTFGELPLGFAAVHRSLAESVFAAGSERELLPMSLDCILTLRDGEPCLSVVEVQSGFEYQEILWRQLAALGHDPHAPHTWRGAVSPRAALRRYRQVHAGDRAIAVLANFPSQVGNLPDEVGWAAILGEDGVPRGYLLPDDVARDERGWFHHVHEFDPNSGLPRLDADDRPLRMAPPERREIRHVVSLQTQKELQEIHDRLAPAQRALLREFLADGESLEWLMPPGGSYIVDKSMMGCFRERLLAAGSPYAQLFVACHGPGERVEAPGVYIEKPIRGVGGRGVHERVIAAGTPYRVPEGHILQSRFVPHEFPVELPRPLIGGFPPPAASAGQWDPSYTSGTIELRIIVVPGSTGSEDSYMFLARIAPTWDPAAPESGPVLSNQGHLQTALWNSPRVDLRTHRQAPFGWFVVTIDADGA
jgi:hypothetical protein